MHSNCLLDLTKIHTKRFTLNVNKHIYRAPLIESVMSWQSLPFERKSKHPNSAPFVILSFYPLCLSACLHRHHKIHPKQVTDHNPLLYHEMETCMSDNGRKSCMLVLPCYSGLSLIIFISLIPYFLYLNLTSKFILVSDP